MSINELVVLVMLWCVVFLLIALIVALFRVWRAEPKDKELRP